VLLQHPALIRLVVVVLFGLEQATHLELALSIDLATLRQLLSSLAIVAEIEAPAG